MLKALKMIVLGLLAVALVVLGVANMNMVELNLLPEQLGVDRWSVDFPLAGVIVVSIFFGIFLGYLFEWMREHRYRREARRRRREAEELARENEALKTRLNDDDMPKIPVR